MMGSRDRRKKNDVSSWWSGDGFAGKSRNNLMTRESECWSTKSQAFDREGERDFPYAPSHVPLFRSTRSLVEVIHVRVRFALPH
jgi:hypothetical protein